ncbi:N-fatty-acyl-amino acid synthase/hydrolase PM20D1-like [Argiope bruennichi]|uniref:N-fatty-acyl-amino acid synthase/hydrolase like protein n=1 Tax=Argiope bruennichi TaxID=94029 RepID=A0A8T0EC99_ARGBR|nr:N-fatty-acyl-amino acid synthase/hydrolase PM20D1-like [Argiope bruennichi]KAF8770260.1 N-fatty-acyl-amino acid synthase/hydrolase like protein [Argiope bruennichi]
MSKLINSLCKIFLLLIISIFILLGIAIFRAATLPDEHLPVSCTSDDKDYISDERGLTKRLSEALKFQTVNFKQHDYNRSELAKFISYITKSFPIIHKSSIITREVVNELSLLYHVRGSNTKLKPYLLTGHLDVVPVEEAYWDVPPFSGIVKDGFVWGRGSIDCKHVIMGVLEAVEFLLEKGYKPQRSFYFAFGHDEESHGVDGAKHISSLLKSRNITFEYILDEGTFVLDKLFPGIQFPVAMISISEKGMLDLELTVNDKPGHSSFPKRETPIVVMSKAVSKLEGDMFPSLFGTGPEIAMLEEFAYCVSFPLKVVLSNIWLFKPFIPLFMRDPISSALHRTTTAVTIINGGHKVNVLPNSVTTRVNLRVHPGQTVSEAVDFVRRVVNDDRVQIKVLHQADPHPLSPIDTFGYLTIKKSIKQIYNDTCVLPSLLIANTDTRWYLGLSESIYRFSLVRLNMNETGRFHGNNEKIGIKNYVEVVNFFLHLIKNSDQPEVVMKHSHSEL